MKKAIQSLTGIIIGAALGLFIANSSFANNPNSEFAKIYEANKPCSEIAETEMEFKNVKINKQLFDSEKIGQGPIEISGLTLTSNPEHAKYADEFDTGKRDQEIREGLKSSYEQAMNLAKSYKWLEMKEPLDKFIERSLPRVRALNIEFYRYDLLNLILPYDVYTQIENQYVNGDELSGYFDIKGTLKCVDMAEAVEKRNKARDSFNKRGYDECLNIPWETRLYWDLLSINTGHDKPTLLYLEVSEIKKVKDIE